jgi:hypothetical protein
MLVFRDDYDKLGGYLDERMTLLTQMIMYHRLHTKIDTAVDHEGMLTITWKKKPDQYQIELINLMWQVFHEEQLEHYYNEQLIAEK